MIQIIISPAKKMNICEEFPGTATTPVFAEQTDLLYQTLKQMSFEELQKLWKCSEKLALQNTKDCANLHRLTLSLPLFSPMKGSNTNTSHRASFLIHSGTT